MDSSDLQRQLFKQIEALLPSTASLPDTIADILKISADSAYRRIRSQKSLSFDEIQKLSRHFNISLDSMLQIHVDSSVFHRPWLRFEHSDLEEGLKDVLHLANAAIEAEQKLIYYEAKDLPLFLYFHFPKLASFKHFFWMRTALRHPDYSEACFEDKAVNATIQSLGSELLEAYNQIPSREIWHGECLNDILYQLRYAQEHGLFRSQQTLLSLLAQLSELVEHLNVQAEYGEKLSLGQRPYGAPRFELYDNAGYPGSNTILTSFDGLDTVYVNYGSFQLMYTHDQDFCQHTREHFEHAMKKSMHISEVNPTARESFFSTLQEKIAAAKRTKSGIKNRK
jgi:hypothetical protein